MSKTQLINCRSCGEILGVLNCNTLEIREVRFKKTKEKKIQHVDKDKKWEHQNSESATCPYCGVVNNL